MTRIDDKHLGISYNAEDFLKYINEVVLVESQEKAYFISNKKKIKGKIFSLTF